MRFLFLTVCMITFCLSASAQKCANKKWVTIKGNVADSVAGKPVAGVPVIFYQLTSDTSWSADTVRSDFQGQLSFSCFVCDTTTLSLMNFPLDVDGPDYYMLYVEDDTPLTDAALPSTLYIKIVVRKDIRLIPDRN